MANDLDLPGSEIRPYNEGMPTLAPLSPAPDTWGRSDVDVLTPREIAEHQNQGQVQFFGGTIPGDEQAVAKVMTEIQAIISGDLMRLGHPQSSINAAITWFQNSARKTPVREPKRHSYNLHDQAGDLIAESWANAMACAGVTQEFISNCLWLLGELNKRLGGKAPAQGRASNSTEAMLSQLSDKDYAAVVKINEQAQANTMQVLQRKWGEYTYLQNIAIAQRYLDSLPAIEQAHFDQFTSVNGVDWIDLRNTAEFVTAMFDAATGAHNIPTSGGAVQAEINQIESLMRTPVTRRAYMNDPQLQGRLRTLYDIRDKEK